MIWTRETLIPYLFTYQEPRLLALWDVRNIARIPEVKQKRLYLPKIESMYLVEIHFHAFVLSICHSLVRSVIWFLNPSRSVVGETLLRQIRWQCQKAVADPVQASEGSENWQKFTVRIQTQQQKDGTLQTQQAGTLVAT